MSLGSGFLRALLAVLDIRGTPWTMRGSFIKVGSSLAGTATQREIKMSAYWNWLDMSMICTLDYDAWTLKGMGKLTSFNNFIVIVRHILLAPTGRRVG